MKFTVDKEEKYTIFKLLEEKLDSTKAPQLKSEFVTLQAEGTRNLILDLSDVRYTDSSGLSAILVGNRTYTENQGKFVMVGVNDHVMKLIQISQLESVLDILQNVEEGMDAVLFDEIEKELNEGENGQ
ncbi:MAG: STAS domain-containing protein [Cytophagales bacterium]|nr:STAS domain-containing protein [Cytophagales bacterium]